MSSDKVDELHARKFLSGAELAAFREGVFGLLVEDMGRQLASEMDRLGVPPSDVEVVVSITLRKWGLRCLTGSSKCS